MEELIVQFGVYHNGKLVCPYDDREDAEDAADVGYMETGGIYEVKEIRQMPKADC